MEGNSDGIVDDGLESEGAPEGIKDGAMEGHDDGMKDGSADCQPVGLADGVADGAPVGACEGATEGANDDGVFCMDTLDDGGLEGKLEGVSDGMNEGTMDGHSDGISDSTTGAKVVGRTPMAAVGDCEDGAIVGTSDGLELGPLVGGRVRGMSLNLVGAMVMMGRGGSVGRGVVIVMGVVRGQIMGYVGGGRCCPL